MQEDGKDDISQVWLKIKEERDNDIAQTDATCRNESSSLLPPSVVGEKSASRFSQKEPSLVDDKQVDARMLAEVYIKEEDHDHEESMNWIDIKEESLKDDAHSDSSFDPLSTCKKNISEISRKEDTIIDDEHINPRIPEGVFLKEEDRDLSETPLEIKKESLEDDSYSDATSGSQSPSPPSPLSVQESVDADVSNWQRRKIPCETVRMSTLDIDRYITEIEDRPTIWDVRCNEYSNKISKAKAWEEICDIFVPGYREMDPAGKIKAAKEIQRKWKSLRDCFRRELATIKKEKSGLAQDRGRKEYMYFRQLSFLLPICTTRTHEKETAEESSEGRYKEIKSQPLDPSTHPKKRKETQISDEQVLFQALARKVNTSNDPEKLFLLSLLPDFKSIPESAKLDVKVEFRNILKRYK